jgi:hypothetical protein
VACAWANAVVGGFEQNIEDITVFNDVTTPGAVADVDDARGFFGARAEAVTPAHDGAIPASRAPQRKDILFHERDRNAGGTLAS